MKFMMVRSFILIYCLLCSLVLAESTDFSRINKFQSNSSKTQWFAWKVELIEGHGKLCCSYWSSREGVQGPCECNLEDNDSSSIHINSRANEQYQDQQLIVYLKVTAGKVQKIKAVSNSCKVNIGDTDIVWLGEISGKVSVQFINKQAPDLTSKHQIGNLIEALAYHQDSFATQTLISLHDSVDDDGQQHIELLLSSLRGESGLDYVIKQFEKQSNNKDREHLLFSISQSPLKRAEQIIYSIAARDKSTAVREHAIFWLSQMDIINAAELIMSLIESESDDDVRQHGVFALSQVSNGKGLEYLEKLIRHSKDNKIRQQALFWLAESDEEKAMPLLESILGS